MKRRLGICGMTGAKVACCVLRVACLAGRTHATRNTKYATRNPQPATHRSAFTLVEIMVVIAIMGIVMTVAIPTLYHQLHPDSMRRAVTDVTEVCTEARGRAI